MRTEFWAKVSGGQWVGADVPPLVCGISNDSRTLKLGECFLAIKDVRDGHDFVVDAEANGASCAIVTHEVDGVSIPQLLVHSVLMAFGKIVKIHRNNFLGTVIGLTGSYGKTSTKDIMHLLFGPQSLATADNLNNTLGVPLTLSKLNESNDIGIIECGIDRFGEMDEILDVLNPDLGLVTGLTHVHASQFGSIEKIAEEKSKMLIHALNNKAMAIFPEECLRFKPFKEIEGKSMIVSNGKKAKNYITYVRQADGLMLTASELGKEFYPLPTMSDGQVRNCAIGIFLARRLGVDRDTLIGRLMSWKPSKMRGEIINAGGKIVYLDCYNANPASMVDALSNFKRMFQKARKTFIIGCMLELGDKSCEFHNLLGESILPDKNDVVLLIGECADCIKHGMANSHSLCKNVYLFDNTPTAAKAIATLATDTIFMKGSKFYALWNLLPVMGIEY
ncbi:MAG: hypothetical protein LBH49_03745 [Puniceicoccales bacterium]|jgi:UDP-N-acetylmuramoyl-tripeptide--D-alanyl-D-alanine ligase|nr:hypothetical protein [Puniceicoccales bacterium]